MSGTNPLRPLWAVLGLAILILVAGCGTSPVRPGEPDPSSSTGGNGGSAAGRMVTYGPSSVDAVWLAADGRTVGLRAVMPGGPPGCGDNLIARAETSPATVWVQLTYTARSDTTDLGCSGTGSQTTSLRLARRLGKRTLVVDNMDSWVLDGGRLRKCGLDGCFPKPTGCNEDSYAAVKRASDVPQHSYSKVQACRGEWMIMDVYYPTGHVCGDPGPGCDSHSVGSRTFYRKLPDGWTRVFGSLVAGCGGVEKVVAGFPVALCQDLPAV
jgi:hypothetical protein